MMTDRMIENFLARHGNGIGISYLNSVYSVICMTDEIKGRASTILGSGNTIAEAIRDAQIRIYALEENYGRVSVVANLLVEESRQPQPVHETKSEWTYSPYRATLRLGGKPFAIVTPDMHGSLSIMQEAQLLKTLNGYLPEETKKRMAEAPFDRQIQMRRWGVQDAVRRMAHMVDLQPLSPVHPEPVGKRLVKRKARKHITRKKRSKSK